jgi:hypothetical protein
VTFGSRPRVWQRSIRSITTGGVGVAEVEVGGVELGGAAVLTRPTRLIDPRRVTRLSLFGNQILRRL